jgi:hypothetical protein
MPESIPTSPEVNPGCQDCGCPRHRNAAPARDKVCPRCGCPDLRTAKAERDAVIAGAHWRAKDEG